jgi:chromosomal replication initiation ATPase DnaA
VIQEADVSLVWKNILSHLEGAFSKPVYETLLSSTRPLSVLDGRFMVAVPNEVVKDWLKASCKGRFEGSLHLFPEGVKDVEFTHGVFTNLTRDHLDFHSDMKDYLHLKQVKVTR